MVTKGLNNLYLCCLDKTFASK